MAMEEEVEDKTITVEGDPENLAVFLGHNLTPPLVEATIMVIYLNQLRTYNFHVI